MSDGAAFLRAIIERPDDDLPRLLYADFLDDRGESERAEYIWVQCQAARLSEPDRTCPDLDDYGRSPPRWQEGKCQCRGCILRRREYELLRADDDKLRRLICAGLPKLGGAFYTTPDGAGWVRQRGFIEHCRIEYTFRRGFVEEVTLDWNRKRIAAIQNLIPLRRVRLTTWPGMLAVRNQTGERLDLITSDGRRCAILGVGQDVAISGLSPNWDLCDGILRQAFRGIVKWDFPTVANDAPVRDVTRVTVTADGVQVQSYVVPAVRGRPVRLVIDGQELEFDSIAFEQGERPVEPVGNPEGLTEFIIHGTGERQPPGIINQPAARPPRDTGRLRQQYPPNPFRRRRGRPLGNP